MLKCDLHIHTRLSHNDFVLYGAKEVIYRAAELKFDVIGITEHNQIPNYKSIAKYARSKGILLLVGVEKTIERKHVLIYGITNNEAKNIHNFEDLRKLRKKKKIIVIAPHPYYVMNSCLGKKLEENIDLFDAVEYCHFYFSNKVNFPNRKAVEVANMNHKAVVGTSDAHQLWKIGYTYTLIDAEKDEKSVFDAIRKRKTKVVTKPIMPVKFFISILAGLAYDFFSIVRKLYKSIFPKH